MSQSICRQCFQEQYPCSYVKDLNNSAPKELARIYALIVGINEYRDTKVPNLNGAVADANSVLKFLVSKGACTKHRTKVLLNGQATKENIVHALEDISVNDNIFNEDPILIYYAGHGAEARLKIDNKDWTSIHGMMQMLIPYDFDTSSNIPDYGQGILDLHVEHLLKNIAEQKSDNLTFIADCCHSGSIDRDDKGFNIRGVDLGEFIIPNETLVADGIILDGVSNTTRSGGGTDGQSTGAHILIAACDAKETSREDAEGGLFTIRLLKLLETDGITHVTYRYIRDCLGPQVHAKQHPLLRSPSVDHEHRVIFSTNPGSCKKYYLLREVNEGKENKLLSTVSSVHTSPHKGELLPEGSTSNKKYMLQAGKASGISFGSEFDVYSDLMTSDYIGSAVAVAVTASASTCLSTFTLSEKQAYAVQVCSGRDQDLTIFLPTHALDALREYFETLGEAMRADNRSRRSFHLVPDKADADLEVTIKDGNLIEFYTTDPTCAQYNNARMTYNGVIRFDNVVLANTKLVSSLRKAADFYWYFQRSKPIVKTLTTQVRLECFKLDSKLVRQENSFVRKRVMFPTGEHLHDTVKCQIRVTATKESEQQIPYGYKVTNFSRTPFFAALFHFDVNECNITPYYLPARGALPSLPGDASLTIGYGDGGGNARIYRLKGNEDVDIGHLKLYLSTHYVDFSGISQQYADTSGISRLNVRRRGESVDGVTELWDILSVPIIQIWRNYVASAAA